MSDVNFLNVEKVKTANDYLVSLTCLTISLATLKRLNLIAMKKGILNDSQSEIANCINWECQRVAQYIQQIVDDLGEVHQFKVEEVIKKLKEKAPEKAKKKRSKVAK